MTAPPPPWPAPPSQPPEAPSEPLEAPRNRPVVSAEASEPRLGRVSSMLLPGVREDGLDEIAARTFCETPSLGDAWWRCDDPGILLAVAESALPRDLLERAALACIEAVLTVADAETDLPAVALDAFAQREFEQARALGAAASAHISLTRARDAEAARVSLVAMRRAASGFASRAVARHARVTGATERREFMALVDDALAAMVAASEGALALEELCAGAISLADESGRASALRAACPDAWARERSTLSARIRRAVAL